MRLIPGGMMGVTHEDAAVIAAGKALAVAALFHLGHEQLALHGGVGVGRAGAAAHEHAQQDVDLRKAAGQMPVSASAKSISRALIPP